MTFLVDVMLYGWIPVVIYLFLVMPPRRAVISAFLIAWLFLPMAGVLRFRVRPGAFTRSNSCCTPAVAFPACRHVDAGERTRQPVSQQAPPCQPDS